MPDDNPIQRKSLAEVTADHLRSAISGGRWHDVLPGVRQLAGEMRVSVNTLRKALRLLEDEGLVSPAVKGVPRGILSPEGTTRRRNQPLVRLVVMRNRSGDVCSAERSFARKVADRLAGKGVATELSTLAANALERPDQVLKRFAGAHPASCYLVIGAGFAVAKWFESSGLSVVFAGGNTAIDGLPGVHLDTDGLIGEAVGHLVEAGRRRIVLPLPPRWHVGDARPLTEGLQLALNARGIACSSYNTPKTADSGADFEKVMADVFLVTPPTGLILVSVPHVIAACGFLVRRGIKVPDQVALVALCEDPLLPWLGPAVHVIEPGLDGLTGRAVELVLRAVQA